MLKHVQLSPSRPVAVGGRGGRPDTCSLSSSVSLGLAPEGTLSSRSSSYTSLNETQSSAASSSSQGAASSGSLPPQTIASGQQHQEGPSVRTARTGEGENRENGRGTWGEPGERERGTWGE